MPRTRALFFHPQRAGVSTTLPRKGACKGDTARTAWAAGGMRRVFNLPPLPSPQAAGVLDPIAGGRRPKRLERNDRTWKVGRRYSSKGIPREQPPPSPLPPL